ncbi:MAG: hypothetical protein ABIF71_09215 [Planctomycetota bacterium]
MAKRKDQMIVRDLAKKYAELAAKPVQEERRKLWAAHFSLKPTRPLILATYGMWNVWCREVFGDKEMKCTDPFYRDHERRLKLLIFQDVVGDDFILEPWLTQRAAVKGEWGNMWGLKEEHTSPSEEGGAWQFKPPIQDWGDVKKLTVTHHVEDAAETARLVEKFHDAVGDILPIDINRTPALTGFLGDISTNSARLRGLEQIMLDMYLYPKELHALLAFMRDGVLANNRDADAAGHYSLTSGQNQAMTYAETLERPRSNSGPRKRKDIWGFVAAQEFTLISPEFHEEFMLQYQRAIMQDFGLVHYGCCENLTKKIDALRSFKNLRSIAVTPTADVAACAKQIGTDYAVSWRPNPTDMVCAGWDEPRIRRIIGAGLKACRANDCRVHIHLKDVETVQGDPTRMTRWVNIVRDICAKEWK